MSQDDEKAGVLNSFFCSVFTSDDANALPDPDIDVSVQTLETIDFPARLVEQKPAKLWPSSSPGPDGFHPRLLAATAGSLAGRWAQLFTESMESGCLPEDWKTSNVTPIYKKGNKQMPGNYRPISLTAIPCKTMESIIRDELMDHLSRSGQLHEAQHGFRPKRFMCDPTPLYLGGLERDAGEWGPNRRCVP